jgi:TatA/E family protein of Tat protein translocase
VEVRVFNIGPTELLVILVIALLVFGPSRLPEVGRTIGKSLREFRRATDDIKQELRFDLDADEPPAASPAAAPKPYADYPSADASAGSPNGSNGHEPAAGEADQPPAAGEADQPPAAGEAS